jgi:hypothetical protein
MIYSVMTERVLLSNNELSILSLSAPPLQAGRKDGHSYSLGKEFRTGRGKHTTRESIGRKRDLRISINKGQNETKGIATSGSVRMNAK